MENDQRLTPLPTHTDLQNGSHEYAGGYSSFYDDESFDGKRSLRHYFSIVSKRLPIIIAITVIATAAAALYMYRMPSKYMASTELMIEPRKSRDQSKDSININFGSDQNYYNTQLRLLQSPDLMKKVVIRLGLHREPNLFGNRSGGVLSGLKSVFTSDKQEPAADSLPVLNEAGAGTGSEAALTPEENARAEQYAAYFAGSLIVEQQPQTNLVNVAIITEAREIAPKIADTVAEIFIEQDAEREMQGAKEAYNDLTKSIEELKNTISVQEADLIAYMRSSDLPLQEKGQDLSAARLQSLSETWLKAMESRRQLEGRYNAAVAANTRGEGMNIPDLYENKIFQDTMRLNTERKAKLQDQIRDIEKQIQEAEAEKKSLAVKYTDEHPQILALVARIESLGTTKAKTEKEVSEIIERDQKKIERDAVGGALVALKSQLDAKRKEEGQALAAYETESAAANVQGQAQTRLITLKREIETNRNLLDTYTQRQKEQELAIASDRPNNIKVTTTAGPAIFTGPQRNRNIMVVFLMSLAAGIGLAFLLDYLDDSVRSSDDVGRHLGLPTLALIPHHAGVESRRLSLGTGNGSSEALSTGLIALEERQSPMAEAYRHLRTSLLFSSAGKPPQTILITSSQPSEGKTTTAINTAITLAQSDVDVVIIDCDLRRPRIHNYFGLENTQGLTNYLSGERNTENLLKTCRNLPKLKIITSGPIPPNPAELLSSNEMKNLLQFLKGRFKHVIIDSPPAISFTDAAILSTLVDGVVLVAMAGKSSIHLMRRFKQRLGNIGARIYGVVLNGIKTSSLDYDYYGGGYYQYYTRSEADESTPVMEETHSIHQTKG